MVASAVRPDFRGLSHCFQGGCAMTRLDLTPLFRSTVGFDRVSRLLEAALNDNGNAAAPYPPYNIEKLSDDAYRIVMAVAGFGENDIAVTVKGKHPVRRRPHRREGRRRALSAPRHCRPCVRAPLRSRRPYRGRWRRARERPAGHRPAPGNPGSVEAADHRDQIHQISQGDLQQGCVIPPAQSDRRTEAPAARETGRPVSFLAPEYPRTTGRQTVGKQRCRPLPAARSNRARHRRLFPLSISGIFGQ